MQATIRHGSEKVAKLLVIKKEISRHELLSLSENNDHPKEAIMSLHESILTVTDTCSLTIQFP